MNSPACPAVRRVERIPQVDHLSEQLLRSPTAAVGLQQGGRKAGNGGTPVGGEAEQGGIDLLVAVAQGQDTFVGAVLVGVDFERQGDAVLLGDGQQAFHESGVERDLHPGDREAEPGGYFDLLAHVLDKLVLVQQPVAVDADVSVHGERGGDQPNLVDKIAEPANEVVVDPVREAAEAGESDDFEPRAEAFGRHFADQAIEVVLAGRGRPG